MSAAPDLPRSNVTVRAAGASGDLDGHFSVRHEVFVREQRLFEVNDLDDRDDDPTTVHLVGDAGGRVVGAVRIYPLDGAGLWQGDRLSVLREHRASHVGVDLVQLAVRTAAARGGTAMEAHIQMANVRFFEFLGWQVHGPAEIYVGTPHQPMLIDLTTLDE